MNFSTSLELIKRAERDGYAVPSFCVWNAETCDVVLRRAAQLRAPVILMASRTEFSLFSPKRLAEIARAMAADYDVPAALHLDHGASLDEVQECLDAGFTSVMLDYSTRPLSENIAVLREAVKLGRQYGATVEGELGHVGKADHATAEGEGASSFTDPLTAGRFVRETGVDILAVSIGNAHGHYAKLPQLDFELLEKLRHATEIPLVLHGGSGTPDADLKRAIARGIRKVNVASDFCSAIRGSLQKQWESPSWLPSTMGHALRAAEPILDRWIHALGAAGKA